MNDSIEFYSDKEVKAWWDMFNLPENEYRLSLEGVPFGYLEIQREIIRRDWVKAALEESTVLL